MLKATVDLLTRAVKAGTPITDREERAPVAASITYYRTPERRRRNKARTLVG